MPFVPAKCTQCDASLEVNSDNDAAICNHCNTPFIVQKAITHYNTTVQNTIHAQNVVVTGASVENLLKRGWMFLEDGEWEKAAEIFERVLELDAERAQAYIGKLCVELRCRDEDSLVQHNQHLKDYGGFQRAVRFADADYKRKLQALEQENEQHIAAAIQHQELLQQWKTDIQHQELLMRMKTGMQL